MPVSRTSSLLARAVCATGVCVNVLLCSVAPVLADPNFASYQYQVDSFKVIGNDPGNEIDEFDDNVLNGWFIEECTAVESGGFVTLMTPGQPSGPSEFGGIFIEGERSSIYTLDTRFDVTGGNGNFMATSRWAKAVPGLNQFFGMELTIFWGETKQEFAEEIGLNIINFEPTIADALGIPSGLAMWFLKSDATVTEFQVVPISEKLITGDILFRLSFIDATDEITAEFSLNGTTFFKREFAPYASSLDLAGPLVDVDWYLEVEQLRVACPGDFDCSGDVGITDFLALLAAWGKCPTGECAICPGDLDRDGSVGIVDFLALLANWGPCP